MTDASSERKISAEARVPEKGKHEEAPETSTSREVEPMVPEVPSSSELPPAAALPLPPIPMPSARPVAPKDELTVEIEEVLEEDLDDLFAAMSPQEQRLFKQKGEELLGTIHQMFAKGVVQAKKIIKLLVSWLQLIPGVNRFFIEQEAKIKTDKIMTLKK